MTVKINYKNSILKKNSTNVVLFVGENYNISGIKKHISNTELFYISDLLKNSDLKKKTTNLSSKLKKEDNFSIS